MNLGFAFEIARVGAYPGFCYELCGQGHSAMPINIAVLFSQSTCCELFLKLIIKNDSINARPIH